MLKLTNINKALEKLNKEHEFMNFEVRQEGSIIEIFDSNEEYSIDYVEDYNCMVDELKEEFGFDMEYKSEDEIHEALLQAVKKDFGKDAYLEWQNVVILQVAR